jgi:hypothetical protein
MGGVGVETGPRGQATEASSVLGSSGNPVWVTEAGSVWAGVGGSD